MARPSEALLRKPRIPSASPRDAARETWLLPSESPRHAPRRVRRLSVEIEADCDGVDVQVQYNPLGRTCLISISNSPAKPATLQLDAEQEKWRRFLDEEDEEDLEGDEDALLRNSMLMQRREEASHSTAFQSEIVCRLAPGTKHEHFLTTLPKCSLGAAFSSTALPPPTEEDTRERMIMSL